MADGDGVGAVGSAVGGGVGCFGGSVGLAVGSALGSGEGLAVVGSNVGMLLGFDVIIIVGAEVGV